MRWKPLGRLLFSEEEESVLLNRSMEVYQLALKQLSLFIFDVIISPLILIVLISYRRKPVSELWSIDLKGEELLFHVAVIGNALIVMHDFIVMPFVILFICVFNFFRIPIVYWLLTDHFNGNNNDNNVSNNNNNISNNDGNNNNNSNNNNSKNRKYGSVDLEVNAPSAITHYNINI